MKFSFILFPLFLLFSCNLDSVAIPSEKSTITLATWNVQTFFDAETSGTEYSDFIKNPDWTREAYQNRLDRLCGTISNLNADVYVFQEIENSNVIIDISNKLQTNAWNSKQQWTYSCFAKKEGTSIGIAVLSKYPLENLKTHSLQIETQNEAQPDSRLLIEVQIVAKEKTITLFANHWKSKSGGEVETEIWRDWQELQLAQQISTFSKDKNVVICGDFNRSAEDFICSFSGDYKDENTILRGISNDCKSICNTEVYSPWFTKTGTFAEDGGSYYFNEKWERIDNIFCFGNIKISGFSPKATEPWATSEGIPKKYITYTGNGYSDHLPVMCNLVF